MALFFCPQASLDGHETRVGRPAGVLGAASGGEEDDWRYHGGWVVVVVVVPSAAMESRRTAALPILVKDGQLSQE